MFLLRSIPPIAPLLSFPKRTKRAVLTVGKVLALLVRTTHVSVTHRHGFDTVLEKQILNFLLDLRVGSNIRGNPPLNDCLGTVMEDDTSGDLGRFFVVGAVQGDCADGVFWGRL